jgi:hypothetical protein
MLKKEMEELIDLELKELIKDAWRIRKIRKKEDSSFIRGCYFGVRESIKTIKRCRRIQRMGNKYYTEFALSIKKKYARK